MCQSEYKRKGCKYYYCIKISSAADCVPAELKEAVRTWPHSDPVSWAQRTSTVVLVKRLDRSFEKAVTALQQNDPKYYRGEQDSITQEPRGVMFEQKNKPFYSTLHFRD